MDKENVTKEMCILKSSTLEKQIEDIKEGHQDMAKNIQELVVISAKLTQLQEIQSEALSTMNTRLNTLEDAQIKTMTALESRVEIIEREIDSKVASKTKFLESRTFEFLVRAAVVIFVIILLAAIGQNYLDDVVKIIGL